jgi:hypothetical protein
MPKTPQYVLQTIKEAKTEKKHTSASIRIFSTQQRRARHGIYLQQEPTFYSGVQL